MLNNFIGSCKIAPKHQYWFSEQGYKLIIKKVKLSVRRNNVHCSYIFNYEYIPFSLQLLVSAMYISLVIVVKLVRCCSTSCVLNDFLWYVRRKKKAILQKETTLLISPSMPNRAFCPLPRLVPDRTELAKRQRKCKQAIIHSIHVNINVECSKKQPMQLLWRKYTT